MAWFESCAVRTTRKTPGQMLFLARNCRWLRWSSHPASHLLQETVPIDETASRLAGGFSAHVVECGTVTVDNPLLDGWDDGVSRFWRCDDGTVLEIALPVDPEDALLWRVDEGEWQAETGTPSEKIEREREIRESCEGAEYLGTDGVLLKGPD